MACPAIRTGDQFLAGALAHVDCQAQTIGAYGFGALADPASPVSLALGSLLAVFVALFGIRLLLGYSLEGRDVVTNVVKVGIVLTLATSWPAWRVLGYDLFIHGPADIARSIGLAAQLPGAAGDLTSRLQRADAAIAALNGFGSGRLGVATGDWFQLGFARSAFLLGTLAPLALVRLMTGILLALAPLVAGLLLFGVTRSVFIGWAKSLAAVFLASLALTLVLGTELALLEPWLQDALQKRVSDLQTLEAPIEILAMTLAFGIVAFGALALAARIAFHPDVWALRSPQQNLPVVAPSSVRQPSREILTVTGEAPERAHLVAMSMNRQLMREDRLIEGGRPGATGSPVMASGGVPGGPGSLGSPPSEALGSSYRRMNRRVSAAGKRRDRTT